MSVELWSVDFLPYNTFGASNIISEISAQDMFSYSLLLTLNFSMNEDIIPASVREGKAMDHPLLSSFSSMSLSSPLSLY